MLNMADEYSEYRYHELFYPEIVRSEYRVLRIEGKYKELKDKKYKEFYDKEKNICENKNVCGLLFSYCY